MQIGLVGKPSAGKSTFFKAATLAEVAIASYPFTTIKPNTGVGYVKVACVDREFNVQCNPREGFCINGQRFVPVQMVDVAGLVPDAHLGKGRGNQFLDDLRQADILIHIIDASGSLDAHGEPVEAGSYNPADDVRFLEVEIDMWYLGILKKGWERFARQLQQEHQPVERALAKQLSGLGVTEDMVKAVVERLKLDKDAPASWTEEELRNLASEFRRLTKPMIIACNKMDIPAAQLNFESLRKEFPEYSFVPCSAEMELALREAAKHGMIDYVPGGSSFAVKDGSKLSEAQKKGLGLIESFLQKYGSTGVQQVLDAAVFDLLKYIAIFPDEMGKLQDQYGNYIPDCFLMPPGSTALDFAFRLHTDIGRNFIRAIDVRKRLTVGKDHRLSHRDVVEIVTNK
jgi:ribosome-binding ATPase YchF (GTP1/OBG family)